MPLTVTSILCTDGFSAIPTDLTVVAGGSNFVIVTFSPTNVTGYAGSVTVNSDATNGDNVISEYQLRVFLHKGQFKEVRTLCAPP